MVPQQVKAFGAKLYDPRTHEVKEGMDTTYTVVNSVAQGGPYMYACVHPFSE